MSAAPEVTSIDPTADQLGALITAAQSDERPVVMVNLLRFAGADGRASYERYAAEVRPHLDKVGATVLYAGDAGGVVIGAGDRSWWDAVVVVRYPSRTAFLAMVTSPGYQAVHVHRSAALETSELIATDPWAIEL